MLNEGRTNLPELMAEFQGINNLSEEEIQKVKLALKNDLPRILGQIISKRADIGWTTGKHTGGDIPLYCYHPNKNSRLTGLVENTDVAKYIASMLGFSLDQTNKTLFVPAEAFKKEGAQVNVDLTDPKNPVIVVTKGNNTLKLPAYKDVAILNGKTILLNGITIYINEKVYLPQQAIDLI